MGNHVEHLGRFVLHGLSGKPLPVDSITFGFLNRKIKDPQIRDVVKKMRTLAEVGIHLRKSGLHDQPGCGNLTPIDRNSQPGIGAAPTAEADQDIRSPLLKQVVVDPLAANLLSAVARVVRI